LYLIVHVIEHVHHVEKILLEMMSTLLKDPKEFWQM